MITINNKLNNILLNVKIIKNQEYIFEQIPELRTIVGFDQKHPHHHLDVWGHTIEVVKNIETPDIETRMAGLLHDIGKPFSYQDEEVRHFRGHPQVSAEMTRTILKRLQYPEDFVIDVTYLVRTHDTIIDVNQLDNTYSMILKRLELQYADAKAHAPETVAKRIKFLDEISVELTKKYRKEENELEMPF